MGKIKYNEHGDKFIITRDENNIIIEIIDLMARLHSELEEIL